MRNIDAVEKLIQIKGPFQTRLAAALICLSLPNGAQLLIGIFLTYLPPYNCRIPNDAEMVVNNLMENQLDRNVTFLMNGTKTDAVLKQCSIHYQNLTSLRSSDNSTLLSVSGQSCAEGWQYHIDEEIVSAAMEFNWVCARAWMGPFLFSIQMFGLMAGSTIGAAIPDRFGRKWPFIIVVVLKHLLIFVAGFSPNSFCLFLLMGLSFMMTMIQALTGVIIGNESIHDSMRQMVSITQMGLYAVGYMFLPGLAYLFPNWRWLTSASGVTGFLTLPLLYYIEESPRWLFLKGKEKEGYEVLQKIAKINKLDEDEKKSIFGNIDENSSNMSSLSSSVEEENISSKIMEDANNNVTTTMIDKEQTCINIEQLKLLEEKACQEEKCKDEEDHSTPLTYLDLYRKKCLRYRILICTLAWCCCNLSYYGSSFNTNALGKNRYINCFLLGLAEIPGILLCVYLLKKIGGRLSFVFFTSTAAIFLLGTALFQSISQYAMLGSAVIAKMLISGSFNVNYAYTGEIFPTLIRNQAYGTCSFISRVASMLAPYLLYAGELYSMSLPYIVMAVVSIITSVLFYRLPETKNKHIPDTLEDVIEQEKEKKPRLKIVCRRHQKQPEVNDKDKEVEEC